MTRKDLQCVHEPFGDAYYFGPERLGYRYEGPKNEKEREESGYVNSTYRSIFDRIAKDNAEVHMPPIRPISVVAITPSSVLAISACVPYQLPLSMSLAPFCGIRGRDIIDRSLWQIADMQKTC